MLFKAREGRQLVLTCFCFCFRRAFFSSSRFFIDARESDGWGWLGWRGGGLVEKEEEGGLISKGLLQHMCEGEAV